MSRSAGIYIVLSSAEGERRRSYALCPAVQKVNAEKERERERERV